MAINLSRNTKVYFTNSVDPNTGVLTDAATGYSGLAYASSNLFEINVLDGYSFSQGTQNQVITISEAGATPTRGQRSFNTQLDAVDWSISTYIKPSTLGANVTAQEKVLWNALFGTPIIDTTGTTITSVVRSVTTGVGASVATMICATAIMYKLSGSTTTAAVAIGDAVNINGATNNPTWNQAVLITNITGAGPYTYTVEMSKAPAAAAGTTATGTLKAYSGQWGASGTTGSSALSYVSSMNSNRNQMQKFGLIFVVDQVVYGVDNCAVDQASIDFGLDAIATIAWTGKGTTLKQLTATPAASLAAAALAGSSFIPSNTQYITNKLSTMTLESNIGGLDNTLGTANFSYAIALTGGNITIANNINYLVPANLGVVNNAINYFTGQRSITGNVTAYLRTGSTATNLGAVKGDAGSLLNNLLAQAATTTEPKFRMQLEMGGATTANRVEFEMPGVVLQIPSVNVADVVACTINFTAQGYLPDTIASGPGTFDLTKTNDVTVRYYAV